MHGWDVNSLVGHHLQGVEVLGWNVLQINKFRQTLHEINNILQKTLYEKLKINCP